MAGRAEGAWHVQGHCTVEGGWGHQRAGESPSPLMHSQAPHPACGLVLPGKAGCKRPLMPVLPLSFKRQSSLLTQLTSRHC